MSFGIDIKVDAPGALPTIAGVEAALAKVEAKGPAVGDALSKGLGAGAPAADKTKQSTEGLTEKLAALSNLGKNFGGALADQFKREADMLDKIHGPAKQYAADLQALDGLMMRGAVTTEEYAAQVTKMNAAIGEGPAKIEEAENATSKLGEAFEALKLPAIGAGVLELGHKVAELAAEAERAQDEYTILTNKALKFEDAGHSQKQIIDDMGSLADSLHTTREKAFELYDTVRDGTDGMRVSYDDQAKMAKEFGLANELAGNGVDQAAESLKRFMYDVASGTVDVRAIRQQMIQVPEIAEVWTSTFHTTRNGLLSMLESGKLGIRDLALAFTRPSEALDEMNKKATKIADTNAQMIKKWAEDVNVDVQRGMSGIQAIQMKQLGPNSLYTRIQDSDGFGGLVTNNDEADLARGKAALAKFNDEAKSLTGVFGVMGDAWDKAMGKVLTAATEAPQLLAKTETAIGGIISKLDEMAMHGTDAWSQIDTAFGTGTKIAMDHAGAVTEAKKQLAGYNEALKAGAIPVGEYNEKTSALLTTINGVASAWLTEQTAMEKAGRELKELNAAAGEGEIATFRYHQQWKALMTTLNGGELPAWIKILDELHEPLRTWKEDVAATNALYKAGSLSLADYEFKIEQLGKNSPMMQRFNEVIGEQIRLYDLAAKEAQKYFEAAQHGFSSPASRGESIDVDLKTLMGNDLDSLQKQSALREQMQANRDSLSDYQSSKGSGDNEDAKLTEQLKEYERVVESIRSPLAEYRDEINRLNEDYKNGAITVDIYTKAVQKLTREQYAAFESKATDAISGIDKGLKQVAASTMDIGKTMTESITGAFGKMNDAIITMVSTGKADFGQLSDFILQQLEKIALQELEIGIISSLFPGAGVAAGAAARVAGSWSGSDTTIPHAANGYAGKVGGVGGTDTRLFAAMVTPGETVQIRTPEQMAAQQKGGGGGGPTIINQFNARAELAAAHVDGSLDTPIINIIRRNIGAVQSLLRK